MSGGMVHSLSAVFLLFLKSRSQVGDVNAKTCELQRRRNVEVLYVSFDTRDMLHGKK
jgi:hypothetical protein